MKARAELHVSTVKDEGPTKSTERVDELGDHATKTNIRLRAMGAGAKKASKDLLALASSSLIAGGALKSVSKQTDTFQRVVYSGTKMLRSMGGVLQKFLVSGLKMATVSIGAMGLALVGIHALFVAGRFLVKSYHVALQGLAGVAAGATVAMGLLSAAMREQQAATFAYTGKNNKEFGSGLNQVRVNMRGLAMDTELAGAGAEALSKVYAEIAKGKSGYMGGSKTLLKDLGDFASAGQSMEEGLLKAAKVVNAIQDPKTGLGGIQAAFKEMGPAAVEALKKAKKEGINTKKEFIEAMKSGKLSALGGVTGQMEAVNGTLMGQFKKYFALLKGQFADFGQQFLPQAKVALEKIYRIVSKTLSQTSGAVAGWEKSGGFVDILVKGVQKISDFYVRLIQDYLPKSQGMFDRLGQWWDKFKEGWSEIVRTLKPFIEGARVMEKMFGNAWRPIWAEIKGASEEFNRITQKNRADFAKLGTTIGETVAEVLKVMRIFQEIIGENLPFINNMIRGLKVIVEQFSRVFGFLKSLPGFDGQAAMALMIAMARGMKTARGTVVDNNKLTQQMNVQARSVSIIGAVQGAYQGFKLGSNPAIAGATGGFGPLIGAGIGAGAKSGAMGPEAKALWEKSYPYMRAANALTGGPDKVGGAAGALGLTGATGSATSAMSGVASSASAASAALSGLASSTGGVRPPGGGVPGMPRGGTTTTPSGLILPAGAVVPQRPLTVPQQRLQDRRLAHQLARSQAARAALASSTPATPQTLRQRLSNLKQQGATSASAMKKIVAGRGSGTSTTPKKHFSLSSRAIGANIMAQSNQRKADKDARGGGKYKMDGMVGGFLLQQGLSKLSNKVGDEDIKGGLGLASSMALFSPKLALGIAGGTFAAKSSNMALAAGGGALAGAQIGKSFGPMGTALGAAIGTLTGVIMAPLNALKAKRKEAKAMVDGFFEDTFGNFMVSMAKKEYEARQRGETETTVTESLREETAKYERMAAIGKRGADRGGKKTGRLSFMEEVFRGAAVGGTAGAAGGLAIGLGTTAATAGIGALALPLFVAALGAIGAGVGAIAGAGKFGLNKLTDRFGGASKEQQEDRKIKRESLNEIFAAGGMSKAQYEKLTSKRKRKFARDEEMDDDLVASYLKEFETKTTTMTEAMKTVNTTMTARIDEIEAITGMSEAQVVAEAQRLGINLGDPFADFMGQLEEFGALTIKTAAQVDQAIATLMSNVISTNFDTAIKQQNAPLIYDEKLKNFRQDFDASGSTEISAEQTKSLFETASVELANAYGGDTTKGAFEMLRQIGSPDGLAFQEINPKTGKRNPLGGLGDLVYSGQGGEAATKTVNDIKKGLGDTAANQLGAILANNNMSLGKDGLAGFKKQFAAMSIDEQESIMNRLQMSDEDAERLGSGGVQQFLADMGINEQAIAIDEMSAAFTLAKTNEEKSAALLLAEKDVVEGMAKFFGPNASNPEWWTTAALRELFIEAGIIKEPDTSTPRGKGIGDTTSSRLSKTLERHSAMNNMISGKRTITSAFRTNNLGSINSDHVTGRAYDLVGNQLGMYKTTVERQGGFAEFHGGSQNRHLHVVPGPGGPAGDATNPYRTAPQTAMSSSSPVQGNGAITLTLNVNGIGIKEAIPQIKAELERSMYEYANRS